jgi:hypothetical protein
VQKPEEVMEILEAYDLTGSLRQAAVLAGCDHKTVAYWVRLREEAGGMPVVERRRPAMEAEFAAKVEELVDRSHGRIRADVAHGKLVALGYQGSPRTTRRRTPAVTDPAPAPRSAAARDLDGVQFTALDLM